MKKYAAGALISTRFGTTLFDSISCTFYSLQFECCSDSLSLPRTVLLHDTLCHFPFLHVLFVFKFYVFSYYTPIHRFIHYIFIYIFACLFVCFFYRPRCCSLPLPNCSLTRDSVVRNTAIPEELGRISYLLTDKTGTLTQNGARAEQGDDYLFCVWKWFLYIYFHCRCLSYVSFRGQ